MNVELLNSGTGLTSDGEEETQQALPAASTRKAPVILAPEIARCFVVDLPARSKEPCSEFFPYEEEAILTTGYERLSYI